MDLRTIAVDGSNDIWLTEDFGLGHDWSPDGSRVILATGENALLTVRCDGTNRVRVPLPVGVRPIAPRWAPDGRRVGFHASLAGRAPHVFVLDTVTGTLSDLSAGMDRGEAVWDEHPSWSPDGTRVVFSSYRDQEFWLRQPDDTAGAALTADLHVMTADGVHLANLTESRDHGMAPAWSPNGQSIAYLWRERNARVPRVSVLDMETGRGRRLADGEIGALHVAWSPDGDRVVFSGRHWRAGDSLNLFVTSLDGGKPTQLTHYLGEAAMDPTWFDPGLMVSPADKVFEVWGQLKW